MANCVLNQPEFNKFITRDVASPLFAEIWSETAILFLANATVSYILGNKILKPGLMGTAAVINAHFLHVANHQLTENDEKAHTTQHRVMRTIVNIGICYALSKKVIKVNWKWAVASPAAMAYLVEPRDHTPTPSH